MAGRPSIVVGRAIRQIEPRSYDGPGAIDVALCHLPAPAQNRHAGVAAGASAERWRPSPARKRRERRPLSAWPQTAGGQVEEERNQAPR